MSVPVRRLGAIVVALTVTLGHAVHAGGVERVSASPRSLRSVAAAAVGEPSQFQAVGPLRLADTREPNCGCTRLDDHTIRVTVAGRGGISSGISATALTVTATAGQTAGFVTVFPAGQERPDTSTLNLAVGADTSNSTIVPVGEAGAIDVYASVDTELIVDITGAFSPALTAAGGRFRSTAPARLIDTRETMAGGIAAGANVTLALPPGVAADARAVVVNVTSVDARGPGFLTGYPASTPSPTTSFMNPDGSGAPRAASIILPVSPQGFTIASSAGGHLIVDLVGWFTGNTAPASSDGLLVAVAPTRLLDTRANLPRLWLAGTREIESTVPAAAALVTNLTMANPDGPGFVTAYPAGTDRPPTSSVNAAARNATTPNMAITSTSTRGTGYYSNAGTDLVIDLTAYFTGAPLAATQPVPPNVARVPTVLMVGDSTLGGLIDVKSAQSALRGFTPILDAKPCRRLIQPSCTSRFTNIAPNTAVDAINSVPVPLDFVVIKTGYNDSSSDLEASVQKIMAASRAKGARAVIWLTYSESTRPGSYNASNATLKRLAGSSAYPDLAVADWRTYASGASGWYAADRVHLLTTGVWATADYISRWVAHSSHLPCPVSWTLGGPLDNPCRSPDEYSAATGTTPSLRSLYGF